MQETLRLSRTVPAVIRQATRDTQILGYPIPEGTNIIMMTNGPSFTTPAFTVDERKRTHKAQLSQSLFGAWEDHSVDMFRPERWLRTETIIMREEGDSVASERQVFDRFAGPMLAFGAGIRGCFGQELARLELKVFITLVIWSLGFDKLPSELADMVAVDRMTTMPRQCHIRLRRV